MKSPMKLIPNLLILCLFLSPWSGATAQDNGVMAHMPEPLTNNAVASLVIAGQPYLYSFSGLGPGKTFADISSAAYDYNLATKSWRRLPDVPGGKNRLASIAVGLGSRIYIFGGYTVSSDGGEISTPEVYTYDPANNEYEFLAPIPVAVDDTVAIPFADHLIYLISGWHDDGNVDLVQIYDVTTNSWSIGTPFPGMPVFGHAGGIIENCMVIADGVGVLGEKNGRRIFGIINDVWKGCIDPDDPTKITWVSLGKHPGAGRYRMAAVGAKNQVIFAGGSDNPYNFNGIGYNGEPSEPSDEVFAFEFEAGIFRELGTKPLATMDHRGLLKIGDRYITLGGMTRGQVVSDLVIAFTILN